MDVMTVRYAVLMKVHYWDDFVERRLRHLLGKVRSGDVYVFVDETHGAVGQIAHDRVIRATEHDVERLGVVSHPPGKVFWFNADYPLYLFYLGNRSYDFYLMCEYDAVLNIDLDEFMRIAERDRVDYVGFPLPDTFSKWPWANTCGDVYSDSFVLHNWLNAISLHSRRSIEFLLQRRQALTRDYNTGSITNWPYAEGFISTEMLNNGFVARQLGDFGKVEKYNWWPPTREKDLPSSQDQGFLHPVLDEQKYQASLLKYGRLQSYVSRDAWLRRALERSMPSFMIEIMRRFWRRLRLLLIFDT
jgi:hypothetical protein